MNSHNETPARLHIGLRLGTRCLEDVVAWADAQIASKSEPSSELIDLAMMGKCNPIDVDGKLRELAGPFDIFDVLPDVLADAHSQLVADPSYGPILARGLYSIYVDCEYIAPDALREIGSFDDEYALARQGTYGTEREVYQHLLAFTGRFSDAA